MVSTLIPPKGLGAAKDAARMERIVNFYSALPKGRAPEPRPVGSFARYQARYFGNKPSAMPLVHIIGGIMVFGYGMEYYRHLRMYRRGLQSDEFRVMLTETLQATTRTTLTRLG
ncbi:hypothetical protein KEM56_000371 [Ascosphaera pollenicola]|nr:hypothetical protein KEM56_000371 [Ascosphaera pollenicola]